jgi:RNA polymerase sigma-70 factor (ECF subfamily)
MSDRNWIRAALQRHEGPLILHARRITGDLERARDVVQETFLRLCSRPREQVEPHLAEWLFTVSRNIALDLHRKERAMENEDTKGEHKSLEPDPAAAALNKEAGSRVLALLDSLPEKQQEVLRLKFQAGLSYKEIQRVTGHSIGNVGYLVHVGLKSLRERLSGDAFEEVVS